MKSKILKKRYESIDLKVRLFLFLIDTIGTFIFRPLRMFKNRRKKYRPEKVTNILILRMDGIGDVVISTAALREIRNAFPNAKITLVIGPWAKGIASCVSHYDHLIIHDCVLFSFLRGDKKIHLGRELQFIRTLRTGHFDLGIDLRGDLLSIIPLFLSGAKWRVAMDTRGGGFLLTNPVRWEINENAHEKDKAIRIVEALGAPIGNHDMELSVPHEDLSSVVNYLEDKGITSGDQLVTIAPRSLYRWKSWPEGKFAELVSILDSKFKCHIVLVGSRQDRRGLQRILELARAKSLNSAGDLTLSQVVGLIGRSSVFIGNDSALIHVAAAMKTPMVQLFGPGEPDKFAYNDEKSILLMDRSCPYSPCNQRRCKCPHDWCMNKITVNEVLFALCDALCFPSIS